MKLSYRCESCKKENYITTKVNTRLELQMELNKDEIKDNCKSCGQTNTKHLNRLHAEQNYTKILIGVLIAALITVLMWDYGFVSTLSGSIPLYLWVGEQKKTSAFNSAMIRRK